MAVTWRWSSTSPLSWGDMLITGNFDDLLPGDTSTFESSVDANSFNTVPTRYQQSAESRLWAWGYLGNGQILTGVNFSCWVARGWYPDVFECNAPEEEPQTPADTGTYAIGVWDGSAFIEVASGTLSVTPGSTYDQAFTVSETFSAVTSCWVQVTLHHTASITSCIGEIISQCGISDIRPQGADTGIACAEGAGGGDGPATGGGGGGGGTDPGTASGATTTGSGDIVTVFTPPSRNCKMSEFVPPSRNCVIFAGGAPSRNEIFVAPASLIYMVDSDAAYGIDSDGRYGVDQ